MATSGDPVGRRFPSVRGTALSGQEVRIPEDLEGAPAVLLVAYRRGTQGDIDRWVQFLEERRPDLAYLELPVIPQLRWRPLSSWIDSGMRAGVPQAAWSLVVTLYQDGGPVRKFVGDSGGNAAEVVLLAPDGTVAGFWRGGFSHDAGEELAARAG